MSESESPMETLELRAEFADRNVRLDRFVADRVPDLSRTYLQELITTGLVTVDGFTRRSAFKMTPGQVVQVSLPETQEIDIQPEAIPLDVLFENADVLVVNKPAGLVVHPAPGHPTGTLVNAILHHAPQISILGTNRPGIVHRLDKDTSGVMVIAKTDRALQSLVDQWQKRTVEKRYVALATGRLEEAEGTIDAPIARDHTHRQRMAATRSGKPAVTHFTVAERFPRSTLLDIQLETGRTHQIRVHLEFIRKPIVGDIVYGTQLSRTIASDLKLSRQFLHASSLGFDLPDGNTVHFTAPLASDLADALTQLRSGTVDQ